MNNLFFYLSRSFATALSGLLALLVLSCSSPESTEETDTKSDNIKVFVSIIPLKGFIEAIGGDRVSVEVMVGPGHSPETYEPTPTQMSLLTNTKLYFRVGVPFEKSWMRRIERNAPSLSVVDLRDSLPLIEGEDGIDPHFWTSPVLCEQAAANILTALVELDPEHDMEYRERYGKLVVDLRDLNEKIHHILDSKDRREFLVFHPAWTYFANSYGLLQIAIEQEGKEAGPKDLEDIVGRAKNLGIHTVFTQPQHSHQEAEQVAKWIDGEVVEIDPLASDYFMNLPEVAKKIAKALEGNEPNRRAN